MTLHKYRVKTITRGFIQLYHLSYVSSLNSANSTGEVKIASRKKSINRSFFSGNEIGITLRTFIASFQMQLDVLSLECKQSSFVRHTNLIKMTFWRKQVSVISTECHVLHLNNAQKLWTLFRNPAYNLPTVQCFCGVSRTVALLFHKSMMFESSSFWADNGPDNSSRGKCYCFLDFAEFFPRF